MKISKEDFEKEFINNINCTIETYKKYWMIIPCNCNYKKCKGWKVELKKGTLRKFYENLII